MVGEFFQGFYVLVLTNLVIAFGGIAPLVELSMGVQAPYLHDDMNRDTLGMAKPLAKYAQRKWLVDVGIDLTHGHFLRCLSLSDIKHLNPFAINSISYFHPSLLGFITCIV